MLRSPSKIISRKLTSLKKGEEEYKKIRTAVSTFFNNRFPLHPTYRLSYDYHTKVLMIQPESKVIAQEILFSMDVLTESIQKEGAILSRIVIK